MTKLDEIAPCFQLSVVYRMFLVPKTLWLDLWGHFKKYPYFDQLYIQSAKIAKVPALQKLTNIRSMKCSNGFSMHQGSLLIPKMEFFIKLIFEV